MTGRLTFTLFLLVATPLAAPLAAQVPSPLPAQQQPIADPARALDAEVRAALFDLMDNRAVPALRRLERLTQAPVAMTDAGVASAALRGRRDLLFLLAEAQYRFGLDSAFNATATALLSGPGVPARYTSLLQAQMLLAAYRDGNYSRAVQLAHGMTQDETRGLASLVSGLASYQLHNYSDAHTAFASAVRYGGTVAGDGSVSAPGPSAPYAQYAQYMDVLTRLRTDTSQSTAAIEQLRALASSSSGAFSDQVRLTAEQLAFQTGRYDDAATLADGISGNSGVAPQGLLTKAWAQYKAGKIAEAGQSFGAFADRYPQMPERDESRLMAAQALLQLGRTQDAGRIFKAVSDSAVSETQQLQARSQAAMGEAARALVGARAAGLLFVADPNTGKTVMLEDAAGADPRVLAMAVSPDSVAGLRAIPGDVTATRALAVTDVNARVDAIGDSLTNRVPRRFFFMPASATAVSGGYAARSQDLFAADVAVALAQHDLNEAMRAHAMELAMLQQLQTLLAGRHQALAALSATLDAAQQRLAKLFVDLDAAKLRIHAMLASQAQLTNQAAVDNLHILDSLSAGMPNMSDDDKATLAYETQAAQRYRRVSDLLSARLDDAIAHHPAFVLRDSVKTHSDSVRSLLAGTQQALASAEQMVANELARVNATDPAASFRGVLATTQSQRAAAEQRLVGAVQAELLARSNEVVAALGRDREAAQFGSASASFFQAIDQGQAGGSPNAANGTGSNKPDVAAPAKSAAPDAPHTSSTSKPK